MSLTDELLGMADQLEKIASKLDGKQIGNPLDRLKEVCEEFARTHSGSWWGHHSVVYYKDFNRPPPGVHFDVEWGDGTEGEWYEYDRDGVREAILERADIRDDLALLKKQAKITRTEVTEIRLGILSILSGLCRIAPADEFLRESRKKVESAVPLAAQTFIEYFRDRSPNITRDWHAATRGRPAPPHIVVLAEMSEIRSAFANAEALAIFARSIAAIRDGASFPSQANRIRAKARAGGGVTRFISTAMCMGGFNSILQTPYRRTSQRQRRQL